MPSIDAQIDAAVVLMKKRAGEFDTRHWFPDRSVRDLTNIAESFLATATNILFGHAWKRSKTAEVEAQVYILNAMVVCALALSLLEKEADRGC
jgi:hypothetical protein